MIITEAEFVASGAADEPYNLANIPDFNSLIAQSQKHNVPVFALSDEQIEQGGKILENMKENRDTFEATFKDLSNCIRNISGI